MARSRSRPPRRPPRLARHAAPRGGRVGPTAPVPRAGPLPAARALAPLGGGRSWFGGLSGARIREPYTGAWQRNDELVAGDVLRHPIVWACATLIAGDLGKMRLGLERTEASGITVPFTSPAYSPVLRKPNKFQTRQKFIEQWILSKLLYGNTYVLKVRDLRNVVVSLLVLDPTKVRPLLTPDGEVFYELTPGDLDLSAAAALTREDGAIVIPARAVIHDVMIPLGHPLIGVTPLYAAGAAALTGLRVQDNAATVFTNGSTPGGVLTAPGPIDPADADRIKTHWEAEFSGQNAGRVAVIGDGVKYEAVAMSAVDSELLGVLDWAAHAICSVYHVPAYKVGVGPDPNYNNITALDLQYYSQCLQTLIEAIETLLDEGLEVPEDVGTVFNLDDLARMDPQAMIAVEKDAIGAGIKAPNEARLRLNLPPVAGGDTPYLQQQNSSLAALDARDRAAVEAATNPPDPPPAPPPDDDEAEDADEADALEAFGARLATAIRTKAADLGIRYD